MVSRKIDLKKQKIALIGDRRICKYFYQQFHFLLDIRYYFLTSIDYEELPEDDLMKTDKKMKTMPLKRQLIEEEGLLLVLCKQHPARKAYDRFLHYEGFEWGEDYIDYLWIIQYYRKMHKIVLEEKNIWIFGAGNTGKSFYRQYKDIWSIKGFISNYEEEKECMGLPVIRPDEISEQENVYIIVCSVFGDELSDQLHEIGLSADKDYSFADTVPKKLFIAIGTCQVTNTVRILRKNVYFNRLYYVCSYIDTIYDACSDADNKRIKEYGCFCDVVFYNIANAETNDLRNYVPLLNKFYMKAVKLFMPFYSFCGQLQQATICENKYGLESGWIWVRGDKEINRMIENQESEDEIVERISKENYWTPKEVRERFEQEIKKILIWDRFASFPIKSFVENNYQKIQVFIDGTHFSYQLHLYLANEIAKYLHIDPIDDPEVIKKIEDEQHSVMPVYPCVRAALGMKSADVYKFWNMEQDTVEYLGFKEHVKKYIQYVTSVRSIYKESGTHFLF